MKLKDYIYDSDRNIATFWVEGIDRDQLEKLLVVFKAANPEPRKEFDFDQFVYDELFSESNTD